MPAWNKILITRTRLEPKKTGKSRASCQRLPAPVVVVEKLIIIIICARVILFNRKCTRTHVPSECARAAFCHHFSTAVFFTRTHAGKFEFTRCIGDYMLKGGYKDNLLLKEAASEPVIATPDVYGGVSLTDVTGRRQLLFYDNFSSLAHKYVIMCCDRH